MEILHEPCEPNCGVDGCQFKGIFIRNVGYLAHALSNLPAFAPSLASIKTLIAANAASICATDCDAATGGLGLIWSGPYEAASATSCTTGSACDCLVSDL